MTNLFSSQNSVDFWVWINPDNWLVRHQISFLGGFSSGGITEKGKSNLMFILNPDFQGDISAFHHGITREYAAEYNLELCRERAFISYPSRLNAIYLFTSEEEAHKYRDQHKLHVNDRKLKKCRSITPCIYSIHDSSWIDFLKLSHSMDAVSLNNIGLAYWSGKSVEDIKIESMGKAWTQPSILEVLFIGRIEFYDRTL